MSAAPASVVLADARPATRTGLRVLLERDRFEICAEVEDADAAVAAVARDRPHVCVVAAGLPGGGVEAVRRIVDAGPETPVVLLADAGGEREFFDALRAGASGYVLDSVGADGIVIAIRAVLCGEAALPRSLLTPLVDELLARRRSRLVTLPGRSPVHLTQRQAEVLHHLRQGQSTAEIATSLEISPVTVRRHLAIALGRLEVEDRADALRLLGSE